MNPGMSGVGVAVRTFPGNCRAYAVKIDLRVVGRPEHGGRVVPDGTLAVHLDIIHEQLVSGERPYAEIIDGRGGGDSACGFGYCHIE